ncbi:MAG: DNA alkylation repair protein [Candidatus Thermoplasmatota archaeon]|nr:DNA alkylation repair protein [Candidatus Thermoplasmatota archaeon]
MTFTNVDDFLESIPAKHREKPARLLKIVREAYTWGVPPMIAKSMTDRLNENNEYSFHLGTTDPELRKIASWVFTNINDEKTIQSFIEKLWKRHGREDVKLAGIITANLPSCEWELWLRNLHKSEPIEAILEFIEEMKKAGQPFPDENTLASWWRKDSMHHQIVVLLCQFVPPADLEIIKSAPRGGYVFEKIRNRILESEIDEIA